MFMLHLRVNAQFWWIVAKSWEPDGWPIRLAAFYSKETESRWHQVSFRLPQRWAGLCSVPFPPQIRRGNPWAQDSPTGSEIQHSVSPLGFTHERESRNWCCRLQWELCQRREWNPTCPGLAWSRRKSKHAIKQFLAHFKPAATNHKKIIHKTL